MVTLDCSWLVTRVIQFWQYAQTTKLISGHISWVSETKKKILGPRPSLCSRLACARTAQALHFLRDANPGFCLVPGLSLSNRDKTGSWICHANYLRHGSFGIYFFVTGDLLLNSFIFYYSIFYLYNSQVTTLTSRLILTLKLCTSWLTGPLDEWSIHGVMPSLHCDHCALVARCYFF